MKTYLNILMLAVIFSGCTPKPEAKKLLLPVIGEKELGGVGGKDTVFHTIQPFSFVNQYHDTITEKTINNTIYVADFFFTTCPTICPKMTANLSEIQTAFANNPKVKLLSHTVFPETDSVPVLKAYAIEHKVDDSKWNLVTGDKKEIYTMARKSYLAVKLGKPSELYDMVHTENFVLVDTKKRVRGFYDGTNKEDMKRLIEDITFLASE